MLSVVSLSLSLSELPDTNDKSYKAWIIYDNSKTSLNSDLCPPSTPFQLVNNRGLSQPSVPIYATKDLSDNKVSVIYIWPLQTNCWTTEIRLLAKLYIKNRILACPAVFGISVDNISYEVTHYNRGSVSALEV